MKRCDNCFEMNSDGATNCVICGESMDVPQVEQPEIEATSKVRLDQTIDVLEEDVLEEDVMTSVNLDHQEVEEMETAGEENFSEPWQTSEEPAGESEQPEIVALADDQSSEEIEALDADDAESEARPAAPADEDAEIEVEQAAAPEEVAADEDTPAEAVEAVKAPPPPPVSAPQAGTVVLHVFHDDEPRVVYTHPVVNDVTLIGREDPQRDVFPDLDLGKLAEKGVSATRASRQHVRLLRQGDKYFLFVYRGTTGTQVNKELIDHARHGKRFEIQVGDRIILGGKVRMKLTREELSP